MFRPRIQAPSPDRLRAAMSSSMPVSPSSFPCIRCQVRVWKNQSNNSGPPTPSGFCKSWFGPAPYPSIEIEKLPTRSFDTVFLSGFRHFRDDSLLPQVCLLDLRVRGDFFGRAFEGHAARLQYVRAVRVLQRGVRVLLDQQHRRAFTMDGVDRLEDRVHQDRREAERRLV